MSSSGGSGMGLMFDGTKNRKGTYMPSINGPVINAILLDAGVVTNHSFCSDT
jgi:hypothetical protein